MATDLSPIFPVHPAGEYHILGSVFDTPVTFILDTEAVVTLRKDVWDSVKPATVRFEDCKKQQLWKPRSVGLLLESIHCSFQRLVRF